MKEEPKPEEENITETVKKINETRMEELLSLIHHNFTSYSVCREANLSERLLVEDVRTFIIDNLRMELKEKIDNGEFII